MIRLYYLTTLIVTLASGSLPEEDLSTPELIEYWGYPAETHEAKSSDGYVLQLHRIPHGRNQTVKDDDPERPVIFLMHTFLSSSADWVINLPETSLGFILADKGFDVWLGNVRGNRYSRKHETVSPRDRLFWDFSIDEHAGDDFPTMVDYILDTTKQKQLYYVGHSQGSMIGFAGIDQHPDLETKIKVFFALAPLTDMAEMKKKHNYIVYFGKKASGWLSWFGVRELFPSYRLSRRLIGFICRWVPFMCRFSISAIGGSDSKFLNKTRLPVYVAHTPAGSSMRNFQHFLQVIDSQKFRKYDHGIRENVKRYGFRSPPEYDLINMRIPTIVFSGSADTMAPPQDVERIVKNLPFMMKHFKLDAYSHMDFVWGKDSGKTIYDEIKFYITNDLDKMSVKDKKDIKTPSLE